MRGRRCIKGLCSGTLVSLLVLAGPSLPAAEQSSAEAGPKSLTILHTNDWHGHLSAWRGWDGPLAGKTIGGAALLATVVKQVRTAVGAEAVLLLDAGDTFSDSMLAVETQGRAVVQVMNAVGYDAMVVGNHDPDFTMKVLHQRIQDADFAVLAANLLDGQTAQPSVQPAVIREKAGVKIGILGLAYPHTALTTQRHNIEGVQFVSAAEVAQKWVPQLRSQGAQLVVVLSHLGLGADVALARAVADIDVIVGGHSHNRINRPLQIGRTLIVQAGAHGSDLGRLDITVRDGQVEGHHGQLVLLDHDIYAPDPEMAALVKQMRAPHRERLEAPVTKTSRVISRAQTLAGPTPRQRDAESPVDALFADLLRAALQVEIVLLPGVGYGVAIGPGMVTAEDLRNLLPHESQMVSMKMTGEQIGEILEQSIENVVTDDPTKRVGGMIQVSGAAFTFDPAQSSFHRLQHVLVQGEPLQPDRVYEIATNSLLAQGGHRYRAFLKGRDRQERGSQYDLIRDRLQQYGVIEPPPAGRIQALR